MPTCIAKCIFPIILFEGRSRSHRSAKPARSIRPHRDRHFFGTFRISRQPTISFKRQRPRGAALQPGSQHRSQARRSSG